MKGTTLRVLGASLAVCGLLAVMGCGKKEAQATPDSSGPAPTGLQSRMNDPNISPDIKQKMQQSTQPK